MDFKPIFAKGKEEEDCKVWSVCYPEDSIDGNPCDIFKIVFSKFNDDSYIQDFLIKNDNDLNTEFWNYMSIDEAHNKILDEAAVFENELKSIEKNPENYDIDILQKIFTNLHKDDYISQRPDLSVYKKGSPNIYFAPQMIRIYALKLEDCYLITGGAIKLTHLMNRDHLQHEKNQLERVQGYLKDNSIIDKFGLF